MPRLILSRDLNLSQPVPNTSSRPIPNMTILLFIDLCIARRCAFPYNRSLWSRLRIGTLLSRLDLGSHQTDLIHLDALGDIDSLRYSFEIEIGIAFHEDYALGASLKNLLQPRAELVLIGVLVVEMHLLVLVDDDDNRPVLIWRRRVFLVRRLRRQRFQSMRRKRGDDHEDDQQHQQHVDKRRHVDFGLRPATGSNCHCHVSILVSILKALVRNASWKGNTRNTRDTKNTEAISKWSRVPRILRIPSIPCFHHSFRLLSRSGAARQSLGFVAHVGDQANLVNAGGPHIVNHVLYQTVTRPGVALDIDHFVGLIGEQVLHFFRKLVGSDLQIARAQEYASIPSDRNQDGVFFVSRLHGDRGLGLHQVHLSAFGEHGRNDHEDDQQHQHDVHHGRDVDFGYGRWSCFLFHLDSFLGLRGVAGFTADTPSRIQIALATNLL